LVKRNNRGAVVHWGRWIFLFIL